MVQQQFNIITQALAGITTQLGELRQGMAEFRTEMTEFRTEMVGVKSDISGVKTELTSFKSEMTDFKSEMTDFRKTTESNLAQLNDTTRNTAIRVARLEENVTNIKCDMVTRRDVLEYNVRLKSFIEDTRNLRTVTDLSYKRHEARLDSIEQRLTKLEEKDA